MSSRDYTHIKLSYIVSVYFNQQNTAPLFDLLKQYSAYSAELLDSIQFIIVDDGSTVPVTLPDQLNLNILLLRIHQDIPWNNGGGRNLGAVYARSDKVLFTDIDHIFPEKTLQKLIDINRFGKNLYRFRGQFEDGHWDNKICHNIYAMSRARFFEFHGYDEDFSGHYGGEDTFLLRYHRYCGGRLKTLNKQYHVIVKKLEKSGRYHNLDRDMTLNNQKYAEKRDRFLKFGPEYGHSRMFLNFPWDIVIDQHRTIKPVPLKRRYFWRYFAQWRRLFQY